MFSRLVLVGMVAALGITVPTRLEILGWIKAAHSWTASRLADWDSAKASDDGVIVAAVLPWTPIERNPDAVAPLPRGVLVAMSGGGTAAESLGYRPGPSFEPIVADDRASGLAHELNRRAEGLDISIEPAMTGRRVAVGTTGPARGADKPTDLGPLLAGDTVEEKVAILWFRAVEGSDPAGTPVTSPVAERRSSVAIPPISCTFSGPSTVERPARQVMATPVHTAMPLVAWASRHDLITALDGAVATLAQELNHFAERIDGSGSGASIAEATRPSFVPIDPGPGPESGLAHELNRTSEGLAIARAARVSDDSLKTGSLVLFPAGQAHEGSAEGDGGTAPDPPSDVGLALRLTREAAHAWMNVLSGQPAVRMSAR